MTTTVELTDAILLAAADDGVRLFRNNSGVAVFVDPKTKKKRHVRYGVGPRGGGGGDLIGWRMRDGKFVSIEIKVGLDQSDEDQLKWRRWVLAGNGLAGEARSVEDARAIWR
jgi:hypothetical protein